VFRRSTVRRFAVVSEIDVFASSAASSSFFVVFFSSSSKNLSPFFEAKQSVGRVVLLLLPFSSRTKRRRRRKEHQRRRRRRRDRSHDLSLFFLSLSLSLNARRVASRGKKITRRDRSFVRSFVKRTLSTFRENKKMRMECLLLLCRIYLYKSARAEKTKTLSLSFSLARALSRSRLVVSLVKKKRAPCLLFVSFFLKRISLSSRLNLRRHFERRER